MITSETQTTVSELVGRLEDSSRVRGYCCWVVRGGVWGGGGDVRAGWGGSSECRLDLEEDIREIAEDNEFGLSVLN